MGKFEGLKNRFSRSPKMQPGTFSLGRAKVVAFLSLGLFLVLTIRAVFIQLFPNAGKSLHTLADRQYLRQIDLSPYRGSIYDRRNEPLAISIRTPSFAINPRVFSPTSTELKKLSKLLKMPTEEIVKVMEKPGYFSWLKRKVPYEVGEQISELQIKGLSEFREPARYYPAGTAAAHLVGFVGLDDQGLSGLEQFYDKDLKGHASKVALSRDARGNVIFFNSNNATPEKSGNNIYLTIDRVIQEIAERALAESIQKSKASGGYVIVSDPHTGRILAVANYPEFDPNNRAKITLEAARNRAFQDLFEPGSVVKPFVIARALELKKTHLSEQLYCEKGTYKEPGLTIHDSHPAETLTVEEVIMESSNICTYKIASRLGKEGLYNAFRDFGFGVDEVGLSFPGQAFGRVDFWKNWRPVRFANIAFGQGMTASGLEIVQAFGAIANGGNLMKPYLVEKVESSEGIVLSSQSSEVIRRVLDPKHAKALRSVLERVVKEGTGKNAILAHHTSAGKTGTSEKVDPKTKAYSKSLRVASFVGFAPVADPHIVIYVVVDEPKVKPYYGGTWAAPVFKAIAEEALQYLNVAPDKVDPKVEAEEKLKLSKNKSSDVAL